MKEIVIEAYAKINLGLDVLRKREDGYHQVDMIMQNISLGDTLVLRKIQENQIILRSSEETRVPMDETNLVYRAIKLMRESFQIEEGVEAILTKRIPMAAGMAGGSTDAAAAFKGMNELFQLGLSIEELRDYGVRLGADIPFCIMGGTARAQGIGEILTPLPSMPSAYILIAKPPIDVSTAFVYGNLRANELTSHPDIEGMVSAIMEKNISGIIETMDNVLETVTVPAYPVIETIKKAMIETGAKGSLMSGSGPTVFGIYDHQEQAEAGKAYIVQQGLATEVYITTPV